MSQFRTYSMLLLWLGGSWAAAAEPTTEELAFFEAKIRPVLIRECYGCHSDKSGNVRGGLRLDTKQRMLIGGGSGPAVVPGKPEESWLLNAMNHEDFVMPPKRKLPANVIADFRKWIETGAPDPRVNDVGEIKSTVTDEDIERARAHFWAYQRPVKPATVVVEDDTWPRTDIDRFVLAKLEENDLGPTEDAEPATVLRRLSFDLIGLPPTPEDIRTFTSAWHRDPDRAVTSVVDRLLASDRFGERWGRHWLDVARYAESTGRGVNMTFPQAWRYRDYVIDAFNEDKPFDQFVQEQIAGDLLPAKTDEDWAEHLVATAFLAIGAKNLNEGNAVQYAADLVDEQIDVTTRVFLGTSVACARCHDHKFDPIRQSDYYAMAGIFQSTETFYGNPQSEKYPRYKGATEKQSSTLLVLPIDDPSPYDRRLNPAEIRGLEDQMEATRRSMSEARRAGGGGMGALSASSRARFLNTMASLSAKLASVDENGKPLSFCMGVQRRKEPVEARVLVRGEIDQPAQSVPRGFPLVLTGSSTEVDDESSGRLELARWIGSAENPLTARVMVNRIWLHMIGRGLVPTTENFGATGRMPSHPVLLDHLAVRFVESGWSVKTIVREIATSRAYRMKSTFDEERHEYDPENALVWRANPRRLDAEAIRDAMLSVSGELDLERPKASIVASAGWVRVNSGRLGFGGNGRTPGQSSGMQDRRRPGAGPPGARRPMGAIRPGRPGAQRRPGGMRGSTATSSNPLDMEAAKFRSVYLPIVRDEEPRSLRVFDLADSSAITGDRMSSNTANQALFMLNNPFVIQQGRAFADRLESMRTSDKIEAAFQYAYGRRPTDRERAAADEFVRTFESTGSNTERRRATLAALCQSLFGSAEFRYID